MLSHFVITLVMKIFSVFLVLYFVLASENARENKNDHSSIEEIKLTVLQDETEKCIEDEIGKCSKDVNEKCNGILTDLSEIVSIEESKSEIVPPIPQLIKIPAKKRKSKCSTLSCLIGCVSLSCCSVFVFGTVVMIKCSIEMQ